VLAPHTDAYASAYQPQKPFCQRRPQRPDAAVLVAACNDAYCHNSLHEVHAYWPGSELRLVGGGHVSAFFLHQVCLCCLRPCCLVNVLLTISLCGFFCRLVDAVSMCSYIVICTTVHVRADLHRAVSSLAWLMIPSCPCPLHHHS